MFDCSPQSTLFYCILTQNFLSSVQVKRFAELLSFWLNNFRNKARSGNKREMKIQSTSQSVISVTVSDSLLNGRWHLLPASSNRIRMVFKNTIGSRECGPWYPIDARGIFGANMASVIIARSSNSFVFLGRLGPSQRLTLPSMI